MFLIAFPLVVNLKYILTLWLGQYPTHTEALSILVIVGLMVSCLSGPLYVTIYATGNIKYYQIIVSIVALSILPMAYIVGKLGGTPETIFAIRASNFLLVLLVQLFFLKRYICLYVSAFVKSVIVPVSVIFGLTCSFYFLFHKYIQPASTFCELIYQTLIYIAFIGAIVWIIGLSKKEKNQLKTLILLRIQKK